MDTYYHINNSTNCNWKVDDEILFGHENNYMWQSYLDKGAFIEIDEKKYSSDVIVRHALDAYLHKHPVPVPMKNYHFNPIFTLKEATDSLGNSMRIIRELAFETIRMQFYPELPSRHKCIWLIPDDKQSFDFWKEILQSKTQKIFRVAIDGKVHRAAQKWLIGGTIPLSQINSMAHKYWQGDESGSFEDEILFVGKLKILEELNK